jgi:hypothetical protein
MRRGLVLGSERISKNKVFLRNDRLLVFDLVMSNLSVVQSALRAQLPSPR